jgi:hypothetical protein
MNSKNEAEEVVMSYIRALNGQEYDAAGHYLIGNIRIRGPGGESFGKPSEFIGMLSAYRGRYDMKKTFADGNDVCLLYNLSTPTGTAFVCSWYEVKDGKIASITTIFDPRSFGPRPGQEGE